MSKLVGISGYDAALPGAYQGRAMGGCGCSGGRGVGAVYPIIMGRPGNDGISPTDTKVPFDIPTDKIAQDLMAATRIERIATVAGLGFLIIGGLYLLGKR